jgi:galactokinase
LILRSDESFSVQSLIAAGLSPAEAERKARLFADNDLALGDGERLRWFVPGRIEVLGKHTDYAGGRSLLCAVERGFCVTAIPRVDDMMRVVDVGNQVEATFRVSEDQAGETRWRTYPATVARRVARNFSARDRRAGGDASALRGADVAFASDLPRAAGVSSSTALIIAIFTVLAEINQLEQHPAYRENIPTIDALASYLGCVENGRTFGTLIGDTGVGTRGGAQDHTAILRSIPGHLLRYAYSPPATEAVIPLPAGLTFAIGASGVAAEKTGAAKDQYNRAAEAVTAILDLWRDATGHDAPTLFDLTTSGKSNPAEPAAALAELRRVLAQSRHPRFTPDALIARLDHFVHEAIDIIPHASDALARGDLDAFGALVDDSQHSAERWLANQIPETIALARLARAHGALASSAFGAGFGGSVWALVRSRDASAFIAAWRRDYLDRFPAHTDLAQFFVTSPGPARIRL